VRQDLRQAVRFFWRRPGVAVLVVGTLGIGIAATTIIFSLADAILWHPLPFPDWDRLVRVRLTASGGLGPQSASGATLEAWPAKAQILDGLYPFGLDSAIVRLGDEPQAVTTCQLSPGLLSALGVTPVWGRAFAPDEFRPDSGVVIVSADLWQRLRSTGAAPADPTLLTDGVRQTVIGVMPAGFEFPVGRVSLWRPYAPSLATPGLVALGKLKRGMTIEAAQALARATAPNGPGQLVREVRITPFVAVSPTTSVGLRLLLGAVAMLLLISVANAANILVAEAVRRDAELAVRAALGASWPRLARQMVTETLCASAVAALAALVVSAWALTALARTVPYVMFFQTLRPIALDWRALLFGVTVATVAGLGASWLSVARARRTAPATALRGQGSGLPGRARASHGLTIAQIAVTLPVLASASLLGRGLWHLSRLDPGFSPDHLVQLVVQLPTWRLAHEQETRTALDELRADAARLPDVAGATVAYAIPPSLDSRPLEDLEGASSMAPSGAGDVWFGRVDEGFFSTLGIPVLAGRPFDTGDRLGSQPVAIVSRALAERLSPDGKALGRRFRESSSDPWLTIVGVVGNVTNSGVEQSASQLAFYTPRAQSTTWWYEGLIVRTRPTPEHVVPELRSLMRRRLPDAPIISASTAYDTIAGSSARVRFATALMTAFAGVALGLALVGVYGAFWCAVRQRTREIGVRLALGAAPADVLRMVLATSARLALIGVAIGLPLTLVATRGLGSLLFAVSSSDPATLAVVAIGLAAAAVAASYLPARRASQVEPVDALRQA
jgi:putative ABC transport system permease protein